MEVWITFLVLLSLAALSTAPGVVAQTASAPTVKLKAISFPPDRQVVVPMQGSPKAPDATGQANVEPKEKGLFEIEGNFKNLPPPSSFGPEYLVYVMWSVTPQGQVSNLGPVRLDGTKAETRATTRLQSFGIAVTAEPYFAVKRPSDTVVLFNAVPDKKYIQTDAVDLKTELLERARYKEAGLQPMTIDPKVPIELYQARNAVKIAKWRKAPEYAKDVFDKAVKSLNEAEAAQSAKKKNTDTVIMSAREAVQFSEDAGNVAITREEEARLAAERKASEEREAAARAAKAKSDEARDAAIAQAASVRAEVEKRRSALLQQLNSVLATQDTDRGLVATMADVTFATGSAELKAGARETLARLAGIVSLLPKLEFAIEGYTDDVGSDTRNQTLSEQRAKAVRDYLVAQRISESAITSKGLGKASPVAPNDSREGRAKNRRVEIVVGGEVIGTKFGG
jgi:outer membrane protein OmpA-like peptidoglycan-associated protein